MRLQQVEEEKMEPEDLYPENNSEEEEVEEEGMLQERTDKGGTVRKRNERVNDRDDEEDGFY